MLAYRGSTVLLLSFVPTVVGAQLQVRAANLEPLQPASICAVRPSAEDPMWSDLYEIVTLEWDVANRQLIALEDSATALAVQSPADVDAQFYVAAVLGARSEVEGGRTRNTCRRDSPRPTRRGAGPRTGAPRVPAHLLGRLNAAVMRMDWVTRFLATRILGGSELRAASWDDAERLLETAISVEPCVGDHHYQLARVYADRGKRSLAMEQLVALFDLGPKGARDYRVWGQAMELLDNLGGR
jgi:hypothetical protein